MRHSAFADCLLNYQMLIDYQSQAPTHHRDCEIETESSKEIMSLSDGPQVLQKDIHRWQNSGGTGEKMVPQRGRGNL